MFIMCFSSAKSFAFGKSGCQAFDFLCKITGKGSADTTETTKDTQKEKKIYSQKKKLTKSGCQVFDLLCRVTGKGAVDPKEQETTIEASEDIGKVAKIPSRKTGKFTELNAFTGIFDFSDDGKRAGLVGIEHQNEELFRNSFIGKLSPITGAFITEQKAFYIYTGVQAEYDLGFVTLTPSFAPGFYGEGEGKDLGHPLEFKSEVQLTFDLSESSHLGMSYNHISNASFGKKNPGANSYMFNFLKKF